MRHRLTTVLGRTALVSLLGLGAAPGALAVDPSYAASWLATDAPVGPTAGSVTGAGRGFDRTGLQADLEALTAAGGVNAVGAVGAVARIEAWRASASGRTAAGGGSRGGDVWASASGTADLARHRPARAGDAFRIGSVTKPMVATLVLQEVARGRWTLDTRVETVLPGLLPGHGDVTIRQLLTHTSGLPDYLAVLLSTVSSGADFLDAIDDRYTDRQLVRLALTAPWSFAPGTEYAYSNTGYVVLGLMLTRATGRSVGDLLERRVFAPAGMRDSVFPTRPSRPGRPAAALTEYLLAAGAPTPLTRTHPSLLTTAGAVISTTRDVDAFFRALLGGRLVAKRYVNQMMTPSAPSLAVGAPYGLGLQLVGDPCPAADGSAQALIGHTGGVWGTTTFAFSSPDGRRLGVVGWTGRSFDAAEGTTALLANQVLVRGFTATCPTPPSTGTQGGTRSDDGARSAYPSLSRITNEDRLVRTTW